MTASWLEVIVEEPSMEVTLNVLLPKIIDTPYAVRRFRGKPDLLRRLPQRLPAYRGMGAEVRLLVLVDKDSDDCVELKASIIDEVERAGLEPMVTGQARRGTVCVRIAVEELEAWFLGDVPALAAAYPGVPGSLGEREAFRDPDAVAGGTAEALERVLQDAGYFRAGVNKGEVAMTIAPHLLVERNRSTSFQHFVSGVTRLCGKDA